MQKQPKVSIITPTYNRAYILKNAIDSIVAQTFDDWELIVMDDGSTDNTKELVESIGDERIVYKRQDNAGPAAARNRAVGLARGEWVVYLDSDNELLPAYLETMLEHFARHPGALYGIPQGNYTFELYKDGKLIDLVDKSGQFPETLSIRDIFRRKLHFDLNGFMHARKIFGNGIEFDAGLHGMEDWDLVMQVGERYPDGFHYVPKVLYSYHQRYGTDSLVANVNVSYKDHAQKFEEIYRKHKDSKLLEGQAWYPDKAQRWLRLEAEYQSGKLPPAYLYPFPEHWADYFQSK